MSTSTSTLMRAGTGPVLPILAGQEIRRYLQHPLFWVGTALTAAATAAGPDARGSSVMSVIVPAAGLGLFGMLVMASLVRGSDRAAAAAGAVSVPQRTRSLALACAAIVPLGVSLLWFAWAVWMLHAFPPPPNGLPFPGVGNGWAYAVLFDLGVIAAVGGPILGLVVARWVRFRGAAAVAVVLVVLVSIVMQGIFEPLHIVRLFMPWTYFGGPAGIDGDPDRMVVMVGSPQWYGIYQLLLCALGIMFAMYRDRESDRRRLGLALVAGLLLAVGAAVLAITMGVQAELVNPVPSGMA